MLDLNHPIFDRFFRHLIICGGCTGPRDPQRCVMAIMCASVEVLGTKGAIRDTKRRTEYTADVLSYLAWVKSGDGAGDPSASPSSIGPCETD